jgi:FlaA1/EpsC-like NDP-sugar epimerase
MDNPSAVSDRSSITLNTIQRIRMRILGMSRGSKQLAMITADTLGYVICACMSAWLLFGDQLSPQIVVYLSVAAVLVAMPLTWGMGFYRSIVRYMGVDLFVVGAQATAVSAMLLGIIASLAELVPAPFRWAITFWALSFIYLVGSRFIARHFLNRSNPNREQVIVYGAGEGGARLTQALFDGDDFLPIALIDDNVAVHGKRMFGLVVHPPSDIGELIRKAVMPRVLLALPSASKRQRRQILGRLEEFPVHVQTIPEISDIVSGRARVDEIRDVEVEDLLGRDAVPPDPKLLRASIDGKTVMVTGAGGSIGSELCRQILQLKPTTLILFEISEVALYEIEHELRSQAEQIGCELIALLGSVHHVDRVREVLETFRINTVYHAAAYKHVPVVEHNLFEGIHNNIFGTLRTATAAIDANVETFVLISTDKAVSPTSVMGATKRFAEMILQALQDQHGSIRFSMVRFGNVLASSGSVVPLFGEQIRKGGPVTVTHRDIIRYFMTIPEAAQLVIQAGAMAKGGDVFVLDMGKPIKIQDLARRMIHLMGLTVRDEKNPDGDIEIEYTGLRPAEKLYEELLIGTDVSGTRHPRIMRAKEEYLDFDIMKRLADELNAAFQALDRDRARQILLNSVSGYEPSNGIDDLVWVRQQGTAKDVDSDRVVDFPTKRA